MVVVDEAEEEGSRDRANPSSETICALLLRCSMRFLQHHGLTCGNSYRTSEDSLRLAILHLLRVEKAHSTETESVYGPV